MALAGKSSAFEELNHPYIRLVFKLIFQLTVNREEAEDIW